MTCEAGESWDVVFEAYDPRDERRRESLLALGNGTLLTRAACCCAVADEHRYPGTYRAGLYDRLDEEVNGERLVHDALVNLPNWLPLLFRCRGEAEWVSLATAEVLSYRHGLDTGRGLACRDMLLRDGQGRRTWLRERRLVSMAHPRLAALRLEIAPDGWEGWVEVCSAIDGGIRNGNWPQEAPGERRFLNVPGVQEMPGDALLLRARLLRSGAAVAVAARTSIVGGEAASREVRREGDLVAEHLACPVTAGRALRVEKVAAVCTIRDPASFEPGESALDIVRDAPGFEALQADHAVAWERLWARCHLDAASDELRRALRLHAFHLLQTVSPHTAEFDAGLPARGWQEAYFGQVFWDQAFAFPFLVMRLPGLARALLLYRFHRLGTAREAARHAGLRGALFPWRSASTGREETPPLQPNPLDGRWERDDTRLQRHVGLVIARDVWHYVLATGDLEFLGHYGAEMMVEIARFWASLARPEPGSDRYDVQGVVGPDEYHTRMPGADDPGLASSAYTNVMAAWTLARTAEMLDLLPRRRCEALCRALRLGTDEIGHWDMLSRRLCVAFHGDGIISQFRGYERLRPLDIEAVARKHPGARVDLALQADGESANDYQVAKQADVLMLPYLLPGAQLGETLARMGYSVTDDQLLRTARYYLARTSHDSSLSRVACAGALAQLDPAASWRLYHDALRLDLDPADTGTAEGVHLGAMAATLDVLQRLYLGLDVAAEGLALSPAVPPDLCPVRMQLYYRGGAFELEWTGSELRLASDPANLAEVGVLQAGRSQALHPGDAVTLARPA